METSEDVVSSVYPDIDTIGDSTEAAKPSPDSPERPSRTRGSMRRRVTTAVTSSRSDDAPPAIDAPLRVLRTRAAGVSRTNESKNATHKKKTTSLHCLRGRSAGSSRSKSTPVMQHPSKKPVAKKASKHTLETTKLSKTRKGKGRPKTRPVGATEATSCKPEAEPSSCGEETGALKGASDNVAGPDAARDEGPPFTDDPNDLIYKPETKTIKSRRRKTSQQKEIKKEESEKKEEENDIKKEESSMVVVQIEDGAGDNTEPPKKRSRQQKGDKAPRPPKRRKKPPVQYVRCEIEGCGTVLAHPRYLQHHIKYQHLLKKKFVCDYPSCGRLFRLQKQLMRHAKHHTDQRDYICEFCARAFKSSHNLAVHRLIHTGEKPIQCEVCGFTCRQKASLNWHMKKHDAEVTYQFSCSICGKKFEKKDSVVAHKAKSHPEVLIAEALAANGGTVIHTPTVASETVPVVPHCDQPSVSQDSQKVQENQKTEESQQEVESGTLTPLQQVVLPLAPPMQTNASLNASQGQGLQMAMPHVLQVAQQHAAPTLLQLSTTSHNMSQPQFIQLSTLPASTVTSVSSVYPQSTLLTLSSVTTLASTGSLASQQTVQWGKEAHEDSALPGEGELWDRVVVGNDHTDVAGMMWQGNEERKKDEGIVWEREGERQILLQCAEAPGDSLI